MSKRRRSKGKSLEVHWSDRAKEDLAAIGEFIAADNPAAAMRWVEILIADVERAASMPLAGRVVPELEREDIREVLRRSYRIVYRIRRDKLEVLTVFEGHRRFPRGAEPDEG